MTFGTIIPAVTVSVKVQFIIRSSTLPLESSLNDSKPIFTYIAIKTSFSPSLGKSGETHIPCVFSYQSSVVRLAV